MEFASSHKRNEYARNARDMNERSKSKIFSGKTGKKCELQKIFKKRIPISNWLPNYNLGLFSQDMLAGLTVGLTLIPQALGYAAVGGLSTEYGLYSGFMGCFVYVFLGTSKDITIGPTAILSLFVQSHVLKMGPDAAVLLAFFVGVVVFTMGVLQMGFIVDFFSYPLTSGFTSAGAVTAAATQFNSLLGIPGRSNEFLTAVEGVVKNFSKVKLLDAILGISTIVAMLLLRQLRRFGSLKTNPNWSKSRNVISKCCFYINIGRNAIGLAVGVTLGYFLTTDDYQPFRLTGTVAEGLPEFSLPPFSTEYNNRTFSFTEMMSELGTTLIFAPVVAILQSISAAKAFTDGKTLDATQEMIAVGMSNILGSFFRSMPVCGSFSRTAVNNASGVRTPMGGVLTGAIVLLVLGLLAPAAYYIPKASLAGVIIAAMFHLFDTDAIVTLWRTKKLDLVPFMVTFLACLFLGLEYGIVVGLFGNLLFVLRVSSRPYITVEKDEILGKEVIVVFLYSNLQYPSAEYLREKIEEDSKDDVVTLVVIRGDYVRSIDATVAKNLKILTDDLIHRNQQVAFWNFKKSIKNICTGIDGNMSQYFKNGTLEDLIRDVNESDVVRLN